MTVTVREPVDRLRLDFLHPYQKRAIGSEARFTWNNWARQTGKSTAYSLRRILRGMARRRNQIILSSSEMQSGELMLKAQQHIEAMKIASKIDGINFQVGDATFRKLEIRLPQFGMRIIGLPANPRTARGLTGDVLLDEYAMHHNAQAIYAAVYPSVLRNRGELDVCSTPEGRQNAFYRLKSNTAFEHTTVTIDDAIAEGLKADRDELHAGCLDDETFRQEFMCEFVDEASAFLTYEIIAECTDDKLPVTLDLDELEAFQGEVFVGWDIARKGDLSVVWAFGVAGERLLSRGILELTSMPFRDQFEMISRVLSCRCVRRCCIDATGLGMQLAEDTVERFGEYMVEGCTFTGKFKAEIAYRLRSRMQDKRLMIHEDTKMRDDLHSIRKMVTSAGNVRLDAPYEQGSHADRFWAAALACHAGSKASGPMEFECAPAGMFERAQ